MAEVELPYNFEPREYQKAFCNATRDMKRLMVMWHRRSGKDLTFIAMLSIQMFKRVGNFFYIFPTAKQGRRILWDGMDMDGKKFLDRIPRELIKKNAHNKPMINNQEMKITLVNGSIFSIVGSDNYDETVIGTNPIGVVLSEYSLQKPEVWDYLRPILNQNGGFAWFNFTPRGRNFAYLQLKRVSTMTDIWFVQILTVDDTGYGREAMEQDIREGMPRSRAEQEYLCSPDADEPGLIYGREMNEAIKKKHIGLYEYDKTLSLYTMWDLGVGDAMCIVFFQLIGNLIYVVDYYEDTGRGLEWYYEHIIKEWEKKKEYCYSEHFAPHDIKQRDMMVQDEAGFAMTRQAQASKFGLEFTTVSRIPNVWDGINITRGMMNRVRFNEKNCERLIDGLSSYKKRKNESLSTPNHEVFDDKPLHDWASNPSDAFRGMCDLIKQGMCGQSSRVAAMVEQVLGKQQRELRASGGYDPFG